MSGAWISVEKKLPDKFGYYLTHNARSYRGKWSNHWIHVRWYDAESAADPFVGRHYSRGWQHLEVPSTKGMIVTHWRYLPQPPAQKEE